MIRGLVVAALCLALAAGCRSFSGQKPEKLDTEGVHLVQHAPGTCKLCDLYLDARDFVVLVNSGTSLGSGVVVTTGGALLTNAHVVEGQVRAQVTTHLGRAFEARVAARDSEEDLALLVPLEPQLAFLPVLVDLSDEPAVGSEVWIVGHPLGYGWTVTRGIVSALRELDGRPVIQTDAAISPGSSGGPMLDGEGHLLGLVTSKVVAPGAESIAFARPASALLAFLERSGIRPVAAP